MAGQREQIHRHSGWLIPAIFLFALLLLSGLLLGWYLRPGLKPLQPPTGQSNRVTVTIRGVSLTIPANFIESSTARAGGEMDAITLAALFPSWHGYSQAETGLFLGNPPDSPVVRLSLRGDPNSLDTRERLSRLYLPYVGDPKGENGPFGLTQYSFAASSGYEGSDLFAGETQTGLLLFLCDRTSAEFSSPNCQAFDRPPARNLRFSYRFKRAYLARWREMAAGVESLMAEFRAKAP
jgi:hypothetical protein